MIKNCQQCNKEFKAPPSEIRRGRGKFCSLSCNGIANRKRPKKTCLICGVIFESKLSLNQKYCSLKCGRAQTLNRLVWNKGKVTLYTSICSRCNKEYIYTGKRKNKPRIYCSKKCFRPPIRKGTQSHLWKGGITSINQQIRTSWKYKLWRKSVFERDNYTCQFCGQIGGQLQVDHIKPFAFFPTLRFDMSNARTLCLECHKQTSTYLKRIPEF